MSTRIAQLPSSVLLLSSSAALHVRQPRQSSSFTRSACRSLATRCKTESNIRLHYQTTTTTHELRFPVTFTKKLLKRFQLFITSTNTLYNQRSYRYTFRALSSSHLSGLRFSLERWLPALYPQYSVLLLPAALRLVHYTSC